MPEQLDEVALLVRERALRLQRVRSKKRAARLIAGGLCAACGCPRGEGKSARLCECCREALVARQRLSRARVYARRKAAGLCTKCDEKVCGSPSTVRCASCNDKHVERALKRYRRNKQSPGEA